MARKDGDGFILDGAHVSVPAAHVADRILFPARTEQGTVIFLVDPAAEGVRVEKAEATA